MDYYAISEAGGIVKSIKLQKPKKELKKRTSLKAKTKLNPIMSQYQKKSKKPSLKKKGGFVFGVSALYAVAEHRLE